MTPRFEVYVPQNGVEEFNSYIKLIKGARILKVQPPLEEPELDPEQVDYLTTVHQKVEALGIGQDQQTAINILQGYNNLISTVTDKWNEQYGVRERRRAKILSQEKLPEIESIVKQIFLRGFTKPPKPIIQVGKKVMTWPNIPINPIQADILIDRFGLLDGRMKSFKEIAQRIGRSEIRVKDIALVIAPSRMNRFYKKQFLDIFTDLVQ